MHIVAVANHKGGTGKTATSEALGVAFARSGYRVLLVDADSQASLTDNCFVKAPTHTLFSAVGGNTKRGVLPLAKVIVPLEENLAIVPSESDLVDFETASHSRAEPHNILKKLLKEVEDDYDLAIIDCAPSNGPTTVMALHAAHGVLVPMQPHGTDLRGVKRFFSSVDQVQRVNTSLVVHGVISTFCEGRYNLHQTIINTLKDRNVPVFETSIKRSVKIAEAATYNKSIFDYCPENPQTIAYAALAKEVEQCLTQH